MASLASSVKKDVPGLFGGGEVKSTRNETQAGNTATVYDASKSRESSILKEPSVGKWLLGAVCTKGRLGRGLAKKTA